MTTRGGAAGQERGRHSYTNHHAFFVIPAPGQARGTRNRETALPTLFMIHQYWVYMVTNKGNTTLYAGVTNDPQRRLFEHRTGVSPKSFAWRYQCWKLVYLEEHSDINVAIRRETQIKNWKREWKDALIEKENPNWEDLSKDWDYTGWYDPKDPPPGYYRQHLVERSGGPAQHGEPRDSGSSPE